MAKSKEQQSGGEILWNITQVGIALGFLALAAVGVEALVD